jgi:serine/threonine-protein kinase
MLHIGRYEIIEEIGRGTAAAVYRARDPRLNRTVALKWFPRSPASGRGGESAGRAEQRAVREARIAASLSHPGIVSVHDVEWLEGPQGGLLIAMEDLCGETVEERVAREGPLPVPEAVSIVRQVARALAHAHSHGIVHRDVKPSNLIRSGEGSVKLADFGIAREEDSDLTREGTVVGTPHYLSPEQARGKPVDARSDLFSLGAVLYYLLTGERPFSGETVAETLSRILYHDPPPPSSLRPDVGREFDALLDGLLAKERRHRPSSAEEVERELDRAEAGWTGSRTLALPPPPRPSFGAELRRLLPWAAVAGLVLALLILRFTGGSTGPAPSPPPSSPQAERAGDRDPGSTMEVRAPSRPRGTLPGRAGVRVLLAGGVRPGALTVRLDGRPLASRTITAEEARAQRHGEQPPVHLDLRLPTGRSQLSLRFEPEEGGGALEGALPLDLSRGSRGVLLVAGWRQAGGLVLHWRGPGDSPEPRSSR